MDEHTCFYFMYWIYSNTFIDRFPSLAAIKTITYKGEASREYGGATTSDPVSESKKLNCLQCYVNFSHYVLIAQELNN